MELIAKSFTYDGKTLDPQYALTSFDSVDPQRETSIKFETNKTAITPFRSQVGLYSAQYQDVIAFEVTIVKCSGETFSDSEVRGLVEWLTPLTYRDFTVIDFPEHLYHKDMIYHAVSLGYDEYYAAASIIGLKFYFECDAPYGYAAPATYEFTGGTPLTIENNTEDYVDTYPVLQIACTSTEEVTIMNNQYPNEVMTLQVRSGQVLTIDNKLGIIEDPLQVFNFEKDFNLVWLHLSRGTNILTIKGDVQGTISYQNVRKRGI